MWRLTTLSHQTLQLIHSDYLMLIKPFTHIPADARSVNVDDEHGISYRAGDGDWTTVYDQYGGILHMHPLPGRPVVILERWAGGRDGDTVTLVYASDGLGIHGKLTNDNKVKATDTFHVSHSYASTLPGNVDKYDEDVVDISSISEKWQSAHTMLYWGVRLTAVLTRLSVSRFSTLTGMEMCLAGAGYCVYPGMDPSDSDRDKFTGTWNHYYADRQAHTDPWVVKYLLRKTSFIDYKLKK